MAGRRTTAHPMTSSARASAVVPAGQRIIDLIRLLQRSVKEYDERFAAVCEGRHRSDVLYVWLRKHGVNIVTVLNYIDELGVLDPDNPASVHVFLLRSYSPAMLFGRELFEAQARVDRTWLQALFLATVFYPRLGGNKGISQELQRAHLNIFHVYFPGWMYALFYVERHVQPRDVKDPPPKYYRSPLAFHWSPLHNQKHVRKHASIAKIEERLGGNVLSGRAPLERLTHGAHESYLEPANGMARLKLPAGIIQVNLTRTIPYTSAAGDGNLCTSVWEEYTRIFLDLIERKSTVRELHIGICNLTNRFDSIPITQSLMSMETGKEKDEFIIHKEVAGGRTIVRHLFKHPVYGCSDALKAFLEEHILARDEPAAAQERDDRTESDW